MEYKREYQMMIDLTMIMDYPRMIHQFINQKQYAMAYYLLKKEKQVLETSCPNDIWLKGNLKQAMLHYASYRLDEIQDSIDQLESYLMEGETYTVSNSFLLEISRHELGKLYQLYKLAIYSQEEEFLWKIVEALIASLNQILLLSKKETDKHAIAFEKEILFRQIH